MIDSDKYSSLLRYLMERKQL